MLTFFWIVFWAALTALVLFSGMSVRAHLRDRLRADRPQVDDDAIRKILETGSLSTGEDEPLDLEEIEDEERRFWSERWDEADEW